MASPDGCLGSPWLAGCVWSRVFATNASPQAQEAARLLQDYIDRISGAQLELREESAAVVDPKISIGQTQRARWFAPTRLSG